MVVKDLAIVTLLMKRLKILFAILFSISLMNSSDCLAKDSSDRLSKLEEQLFTRLNKDRRSNKLPQLAISKRLCKLAREHAEDMLKIDFFSHSSSDGLNTQQRARSMGIRVPVYENIGWRSGPDKSSEMVLEIQESYMNEPKNKRNHRYIILLEKLKFVGVGVSKKKDQVSIVQVVIDKNPVQEPSVNE